MTENRNDRLFDQEVSAEIERWHDIDRFFPTLASLLQPDMAVLGIGCGPWPLTIDVGQRVRSGRVTGVDVSPESVEEVRRLAANDGQDNVEFHMQEATALDFSYATASLQCD